MSLKNSSATDVYGLTVGLIKAMIDVLISPLTSLVNTCIRESCFPKCLQFTSVGPVYKNGDKNLSTDLYFSSDIKSF